MCLCLLIEVTDGELGWLIIEDVITTSSSGIEADLFRFVKRGDVWVLTHFEGLPHCAPVGKPDLVIESVETEPSTVEPGQVFKLSSTLRNNGTGVSAPTTVRYYRSTNDTISTTDTEFDALAETHSIQMKPSADNLMSLRRQLPAPTIMVCVWIVSPMRATRLTTARLRCVSRFNSQH